MRRQLGAVGTVVNWRHMPHLKRGTITRLIDSSHVGVCRPIYHIFFFIREARNWI